MSESAPSSAPVDVGPMTFRPLVPDEDGPLIHDWVQRPYARYWGMEGLSVAQVTEAYRNIHQIAATRTFMGIHRGTPAFLMEVYDPQRHPVADLYDARDGDRGMHLLLGPPDPPIHGFSRAVMAAVLEFIFAEAEAARVVVEPDIRNDKIRRLNVRLGFVEHGPIELPAFGGAPAKRAMLSFCTREAAVAAMQRSPSP